MSTCFQQYHNALFLLNSRIPLVCISSELIFTWCLQHTIGTLQNWKFITKLSTIRLGTNYQNKIHKRNHFIAKTIPNGTSRATCAFQHLCKHKPICPSIAKKANSLAPAQHTEMTLQQPKSSEPRFLANVQRYFADFPYFLCLSNQRLFTLETCCGYQYESFGNNNLVCVLRNWHCFLPCKQHMDNNKTQHSPILQQMKVLL